MISFLVTGDNPPLYDIILHFWMKLVGIHSYLLRIPSIIFSSITVTLLYKIINVKTNFTSAILSSILMLSSGFFLIQSFETRSYPLFLMIQMLLVKKLNNTNLNSGIIHYIAIVLLMVISFFTHYLFLPAIFVYLIIILLKYSNQKKIVINFVYCFAIFSILVSLYFPVIINRLIVPRESIWLKHIDNPGHIFFFLKSVFNNSQISYFILITTTISGLIIYISKQKNINSRLKMIIQLLLLFVFLYSLSVHFKMPFIWRAGNIKYYSVIFTVILFSIAIILIKYKIVEVQYLNQIFFPVGIIVFFVAGHFIEIFHLRYLYFFIPFSIIFLFSLLYRILNNRFYYIVMISMISLNFFHFNTSFYGNNNIEKIINSLEKNKPNKLNVVLCSPYFMYQYAYHFEKKVFIQKGVLSDNLRKVNVYPAFSAKDLNLFDFQKKTVFINHNAEKLYPENGIENFLNSNFKISGKNKISKHETINYYEPLK